MDSIQRHGLQSTTLNQAEQVDKLKAIAARKRGRAISATDRTDSSAVAESASQSSAPKKPRNRSDSSSSSGSASSSASSSSDSSTSSVHSAASDASSSAGSHTGAAEAAASSTLANVGKLLRRDDGGLSGVAAESSGRRAVRQALIESAGAGAGGTVGSRAMLHTKAVGAQLDASGSLAAVAQAWGLSPALLAACEGMGFDRWFPVQRDVVPALLAAVRAHDTTFMGDVAITAPTGSGKTLAYLLPMLQALAGAPGAGLRGLVLLPTRELAAQVHAIAAKLGDAVGLKVALCTGEQSFAADAAVLRREGGVDIIVATPGRLVDHLDNNTHFSLTALQWLIVDEADRLLAQAYNHWVRRVYDAVWTAGRPPVGAASEGVLVSSGALGGGAGSNGVKQARAAALAALTGAAACGAPGAVQVACVPLRRVLVSATLTNNPRHIALMALHKPTHFTTKQDVSELHGGVQAQADGDGAADAAVEGGSLADGTASGKFVTPSNLAESYVVVPARDKALAALHLVFSALAAAPAGSVVLVFTGSIPATHRLARLLQLHGLGRTDISADADGSHNDSISANSVAEFSSGLRQELRSGIIQAALAARVRVVVSSDATARGLDLSNVAATVSYDPAASIRTYVHRVGRAARAGRAGTAHTILVKKQRKFFVDMMQTLRADYLSGPDGAPKVAEAALPADAFSPFVARYKRALAQLPALLAAEARGDVESYLPVAPMEWVQGEGVALLGNAGKVKGEAKKARLAAAKAEKAAAAAAAAASASSSSSDSDSSSSSDSDSD